MNELSSLLQKYFLEYLIEQRQVSKYTIASYRDTFSLFLKYINDYSGKKPVSLKLNDISANLIQKFLKYLEKERQICNRTRNQRLAAIKSFFQYILIYVPDHANTIKQILSIPEKRYDKKIINFLEQSEVEAILRKIDRKTWIGCRDHAIITVMIQTGLRVSELTSLCLKNVKLNEIPYIHCTGKGRKERTIPLTKWVVLTLKNWIALYNQDSLKPLFPSSRGGFLSSDSIQYLLLKYKKKAILNCPSLKSKKLSPHVLRHTTAVNMLKAGIDCSIIALWLGHASLKTTYMYLESNIEMKEKIMEKIVPITKCSSIRYKANDDLITFLKTL